MPTHSIVILIDHKGRDLMGAALIAHHLEKLGVRTHLEPLESWRSCLTAWKPSMILFNHITTKALADYSAELNSRGVLTASLLNEGLCLTDSYRHYASVHQFPNLHCDLFLTWNQLHCDDLRENNFCTPAANAITVGVPRFDFYKDPWLKAYTKPRDSKKVHILVNTTFAIAHFFHRSDKEQEMLYAALGNGKIPETIDYKSLIKAHHEGMLKVPKFLRPLLESGKYTITLRPHPREELTFYQDFIQQLPDSQKELITLDKNESIFSAIINADIILNCEDCTTSIESWIAGKPTLTLTFAKNPVFFTPPYSDKSPQVHDPTTLLSAIDEALAHPEQKNYADLRKDYLEKWVYKVDGCSAFRAAAAIHQTLVDKSPKPRFPKDFSNVRRGIKLRLLRLFNEPSHARFSHILKRHFIGDNGNQSIKYRDYLKAVRPNEALNARKIIRKAENS